MQVRAGIWELTRRRLRSRSRRGVILVLSTAMLLVMFGFAACAIDLGYIVLTGQQLQNASDSAVLAAVLELKGGAPGVTRQQLKDQAVLAAQKAGLLNYAANRPVQIYPEDIQFGNRSYDYDTGTNSTTWEAADASNTGGLNAVKVNLSFKNGGQAGRGPLQLYFAPVIGIPTTGVNGDATSFLTPRDLVFVIDISGSMFGGSGGNQNQDALNATKLLLGNIYTATTPAALNSTSNTAYTNLKTGNAGAYIGGHFPARYPQRVARPALRGNYQALWELAFNPSTPSTLPNIDRADTSDTGLSQEDPIDYFQHNSGGGVYSFEMGDSAFGTNGQMTAFLNQEFPDRDAATPWTHWKWQAYCDQQFSSTDKNESKQVYYGNTYDGYTNPTNLNVPAAPRCSMIMSNPAANGGTPLPGGSYVNTIVRNRANAMYGGMAVKDVVGGVPVKLDYVTVLGPQSYARFCLWNGYIPCVRGQKFYARDKDSNDVLDAAPASESPYYPQPEYMGYYPRTMDIEGFNESLLGAGAAFHGVYPGDIGGPIISYVRQGTLFGLNAMIEQEATAGGGAIAFNQVGMVSFGTMGWLDLELTNDLHTALRVGASRLTCYPGQPLITPKGSGRTNWGGGLREAVKSLTTGPKARSFAAKSIVLLSDGAPNFIVNGYSPGSGFKNPEFNVASQTDNLQENSSLAPQYGKDWATEAAVVHGITIHAVGFNITPGSAEDDNLEAIAVIGNGLYKNLPGTAAGFDELKKLFVNIAKDRLGQLYAGD